MSQVRSLLATGHAGFVGTALRAHVGHDGSGLRWCTPEREYDVLDCAALTDMLRHHRPDWVVHLAAQSHVPSAWADPATTLHVNAGGTASLLKALTDSGFTGRLLFVSSADVYGAVAPEQLPIDEDCPAEPRNPYASSKVAAEVLCRQWARTRGLDVVIARPFNHTGAGQRPDFALPAFARELAAIRLGLQPPRMATGDLNVTRDFLDVRDVVRAYVALLEHGRSGQTYNVCSGREVLLADALAQLQDIAGVRPERVTDAARLRPAEQRRVCGSHARLSADTGWTPRIALRETLTQLIDHWTQELQP